MDSLLGRSAPGCWDDKLKKPGPVTNVLDGHWGKTTFRLVGGANHAKLGVSTSKNLAIFGDMNQEGSLTKVTVGGKPRCELSQNPRGGLFFVLEDKQMAADLRHMFLPK